MKRISAYLQYIPSSREPLSADAYLIDGEKYVYIFGVGSNEETLRYLSDVPKEKIVILSHFHQDHTANIDKLSYEKLYVGGLTAEKIQKGIVVETCLTIHDGVKIEIRSCPSPHTEGSLIVTVNGEYTLLADLYFTKPGHNQEMAYKMLETLRTLDTKYFVVSHQENENIFEKEYLLRELGEYFQMYDAGEF